MFNRVFLDTNIFIDFLINADESNQFDKIRNNIDDINKTKEFLNKIFNASSLFVISSSSIMNTFFILTNRQKIQESEVSKVLLEVEKSNLFHIVDEVKELRILAEEYSVKNNTDLEDTLQYFCAKSFDCDIIITNDKNFPKLDIPLIRTNPNLENYTPENKSETNETQEKKGVIDNIINFIRKNK